MSRDTGRSSISTLSERSDGVGREELEEGVSSRKSAAGSVGALDHVLKKTFKDFFFEDEDEEARDEHIQTELPSNDRVNRERSTTKVDVENKTEEVSVEVKAADEEAEEVHAQPETVETKLKDMTVLHEISGIDKELKEALQSAEELESYLEKQRIEAEEEDKREAEKIYEKGLLVGVEYPLSRSHLALAKKEGFGSTLIIAKEIMDENETLDKYRRGQIKLGDSDLCHIRPTTPNYQKSPKPSQVEKSTNQQIEDEQQGSEKKREAGKEKERVMARDKETKMRSVDKRYNEERLEKLRSRLNFLRNPRFQLTTKATRDWQMSLLNKDLSQPPVFSQQELLAREDCQPKGFLDADFLEAEPNLKVFSRTRTKDLEEHLQAKRHAMRNDPTTQFSFRAEPSHARFEAYEINQVVECTLKVFNVSNISRSIRFLPPTTKYFSIAATDFPTGPGIIAPGMACTITIHFCPDSVADYSDYITVATETEKFRIALVAKRQTPRLTITETLNCGSCFVGGQLSTDFSCKNRGGPGRFQFLSLEEWKHPSSELDYSDRPFLRVGQFKVSPVSFSLEHGEEIPLKVEFNPEGTGTFCQTVVLACDNCQIRKLTFTGSSCRVEVKVAKLDTTLLDLGNKSIQQPKSFLFDSVVVGTTRTRRITLRNPTPIALNFHWELMKQTVSSGSGKHHGRNRHSSRKSQRSKVVLAKDGNSPFSIEPMHGTLEPGEEIEFTVTFSPGFKKKFSTLANFVVEKIPAFAVPGYLPASKGKLRRSSTTRNGFATPGNDTNKIKIHGMQELDLAQVQVEAGASTPTSELLDIACLKVLLQGLGALPTCELVPCPVSRLDDNLLVGSTYKFSSTLKNTSPTPVYFAWRDLEDETTRFVPEEVRGTLQVGEERHVQFSVVAFQPTSFVRHIRCELAVDPEKLNENARAKGNKEEIGGAQLQVVGRAKGPDVQILAKELDFGLLSVNTRASVTVPLKNHSSIPAHLTFRTRDMSDESSVPTAEEASLVFEPAELVLPPLGQEQVVIHCNAGSRPERLRKVLESFVRLSGPIFVPIRGEIQSPKVFIEPIKDSNKSDKGCEIDLGTTFVSVPVTRRIRMVNLSNLPAAFKWTELPLTSSSSTAKRNSISSSKPPSRREEAGVQGGGETLKQYDVELEWEGELGPKEERVILLHFNPRRPGRVNTLFVCDVEGMNTPLGFQLKTLSRGLTVSYALVGDHTTPKEMHPEEPVDGEPTSEVPAANSKLPVLDFGDGVELCDRKRLRLCMMNHSAIRAEYKVVVKNFAAPCIPRSIQRSVEKKGKPSMSVAQSDGRQTRASSGFSPPTSPVPGGSPRSKMLRGAKLSDKHEETDVFISEKGRAHTMKKIQAEEDKEVLVNGDGVAFLAIPATGFLEPWQSVIVDVVCFNNMSGSYRSDVDVLIDGLPPMSTTLKVNVVGSPLQLQSNTVGLVMNSKTKANDPEAFLNFGHALIDSEPVRKVIKVVNNGPIKSKLTWQVIARRSADADIVETKIELGGSDPSSLVSVKISPHSELVEPPPFVIEPAEQIVPAYGQAAFRVSYFPDKSQESLDGAYLVADGRWLDESEELAKTLSNANSQASFHSLVASVVSNAEDLKGVSEHHKGAIMASISGSLSNHSLVSQSELSSGLRAIHRSPLRGILRVELSGQSVHPSLCLDRRKRGPDLKQYLGFVVWSTNDLEHSSFFKTITFSNQTPLRLPCQVSITAPFYVAQCKISSSTDPALTKEESSQLVARFGEGNGSSFCLPPGATLVATLRFRPPSLLTKHPDINEQLRTTTKGSLRIDFLNGDAQSVDLEGTVVRPTIFASPPSVDFGYVHVETSVRTALRFSNPTVVPAKWKIEHIPGRMKLEDDIRTNDRTEVVDDPSCWSFDVEEGLLEGPSLPLSSANSFMPKGFDMDGKRCPQTVHVCFHPSVEAEYESRFRVTVRKGASFLLLLRGFGSYGEEHDTQVKTLPKPRY